MKSLKFLFFGILVTFCLKSKAQEIDSFSPVVRFKYSGENKVKMRLVSKNFFEMRALATSGLRITYSQILTKDGNSIKNEKEIIIDTPQRKQWEIAKNDKQVAAMAAALFSKFKGEQTDEFLSLRERVNFQNNLHLFGTTASSFSWNAAKLSNHGVELEMEEGSVYRISIRLLRDNKFCPNNTLTIYYTVRADTIEKLPLDFTPGDLVVYLKWPKIDDLFAFDIERKNNLNSWMKINDNPILPSGLNDSLPSFFHIAPDSTKVNYSKFSYRVWGYDVFGNKQMVTNELTGVFSKDLTPPPAVSGLNFKSNSQHQILLNWNIKVVPDLKKMKIYYGNSNRGPFRLIKELSQNATQFQHDSASNYLENYYVVSTVDTANNEAAALPFNAITYDTIAPPPQAILEGKITPNGTVYVSWLKSQEQDVVGYRLFRSFGKENKFTPILGYNIKDTFCIDTVPIKNILGNAFYAVKPIDSRGNLAQKIIPFKIIVPDVIPPMSPMISDIVPLTSGGVKLFVKFQIEDTKLLAYRKREIVNRETKEWGSWIQIKSSSEFMDTTADFDRIYEYQLKAIDSSGNASNESNILGQKTYKKKIEIEKIQFTATEFGRNSVKISWTAPKDNRIAKIEIYRAVKGQSELFIQSIDVNDLVFIDVNAPHYQTSIYTFKFISNDGMYITHPIKMEVTLKN